MQIVDEKSFKIFMTSENLNYRNNLGVKLRIDGFNIEYASGGFHLLHLIEEADHTNLVILHENMHDMSALEMILLIRSSKTKTELPILFISKEQKAEEIKEIITNGANDFIVQAPNYSPIVERIKKYFLHLKNS
jgi:DNA-binding response OmpR family regulator